MIRRRPATPVKFDPDCPRPYDPTRYGDQGGVVYMTKTLHARRGDDGEAVVQAFDRHYNHLGDITPHGMLKLGASGTVTDKWDNYTAGTPDPGSARWWKPAQTAEVVG